MSPTGIHVALIDDDPVLTDLLSDYLSTDAFQVSVINDSRDAMAIGENDFDILVLDVGMPVHSGFEVLQSLRTRIATPILMLTGRGDDIDRILGLEMGADDYLCKPCNPRELAARLRAIIRRGQVAPRPAKSAKLSLHGIELNSSKREVSLHQQPLNLTSAEFDVLALLMKTPGEVVSKEALTETVLHRKLTPFDRSIDVHISRLRQKLGAPDLIKTRRGAGYMLVSED